MRTLLFVRRQPLIQMASVTDCLLTNPLNGETFYINKDGKFHFIPYFHRVAQIVEDGLLREQRSQSTEVQTPGLAPYSPSLPPASPIDEPVQRAVSRKSRKRAIFNVDTFKPYLTKRDWEILDDPRQLELPWDSRTKQWGLVHKRACYNRSTGKNIPW
jgi:hypothetical protein